MKILILYLLFACALAAREDSCFFKPCECMSEQMADEILESNEQPGYIYDIICRFEDTSYAGTFPPREDSARAKNAKIYVFDLQSNKIGSIPDYAFSGLNIQYLDLNLNEIKTIGNNSFVGLTGNVALDLSSNKIDSIEENAFNHGTFSIRSLKIENNRLGYMNPDDLSKAFKSLDSLTALQMGENHLDEMPVISHMTELKQLSVYQNQLEDLTNIPSSVSDLNFDHNRIKSIEADTLSNLKYLKYLSLDSNQISHIDPNAFSHLVELVSINLARNYIKFLPQKFIYNLINLDRLDLSDQNGMLNNISAYAFDRQSNEKFIKSIDLSGNKLSDFSKKAFCSHNQSNSYINVIELVFSDELKSQVKPCWFVHLSRGYHSKIKGLDNRKPKLLFKKSIYKIVHEHYRCSCEFEKARFFVNLDGLCLMNDGQLVPMGSYSCQGNYEKSQIESECDSSPEDQCSAPSTPTVTPEASTTTLKTSAAVEFVHEAEKPEVQVSTSTPSLQEEKTNPVEKPEPVIEDKVKENKNDKSNTLPTKQTILSSSSHTLGNMVLLFASTVLVSLIL